MCLELPLLIVIIVDTGVDAKWHVFDYYTVDTGVDAKWHVFDYYTVIKHLNIKCN